MAHSKIFDTGTIEGIQQAERFKQRAENRFASVNVYTLGLNRVQIVALNPIVDLEPVIYRYSQDTKTAISPVRTLNTEETCTQHKDK